MAEVVSSTLSLLQDLFLFSNSKACDANIAIIVSSVFIALIGLL